MEAPHCRRDYWSPICDMTNDVGDEGLRNGHASDRADQDREDWNFWASVAPREAKWIERSPRLISLNLIRLSSANDRNCCLDFSARYPEESVPILRALRRVDSWRLFTRHGLFEF